MVVLIMLQATNPRKMLIKHATFPSPQKEFSKYETKNIFKDLLKSLLKTEMPIIGKVKDWKTIASKITTNLT